jgi:acetolactate synthase-1/2/3 large subunit
MIRVADYISKKLVEFKIRHIFTVTGGGAMHLNDAFGKNTELACVYNHHEQACAMAAESYARLSGRIAAVCVTSGPGGTNAITGVLGGWLDSISMLVISGQVRFDTTTRSSTLKLRQLGDQEFDITGCVQTMTKYAVMVTDANTIRYHLERAFHLATTGRHGPCWIDVPLNIQGALVDEKSLMAYDPAEDCGEIPPHLEKATIDQILELIKNAKRPVLFAGSAIRLAGAYDSFIALVERLNIPVVTAWNAHDSIWDAHPMYFGRPGTLGDRAGNFIVANTDLLLVLGSRLNIRQISYNWTGFAKNAYKIVVDIDKNELKKPTLNTQMPVHADVKELIEGLNSSLDESVLPPKQEWLEYCKNVKHKYPAVLESYWHRTELVNPYCFAHKLTEMLPENQIIVTGNGSACVCTFQAAVIKRGQRLYTNSGCASMGYDLPAAIGAAVALGGQPVICIAGDGSLQMNIQELQTIVHYDLPVKVFILNNNGYHSIRQTQSNFFGQPLVGCTPDSGVSFPDAEKIAYAYGIPFVRCSSHADLKTAIAQALSSEHAFICEIMLTAEQGFAPRTSSKKLPDGTMVSTPLEDMFPFLAKDEFDANML